MSKNFRCPNCGADEFITEPNQYDVMKFTKNGFENQSTESMDDYKIYCRECAEEVDVLKSLTKVVLKK